MVSHEQLVVAVDTHYRKTVKGLGDLRQSIAADNEEITRKMDELKSLCLQSTGVRLPGPTDPAQVALALETTDKQDAAIKDFGADWLVSVQASPLNSVCAQEDLPARFIKAKESSAAASAHMKRSYPPTAASARAEPRTQRARQGDILLPFRTVKWIGDSAETFTCPAVNGKLAEPLPSLFSNWIQGMDHDESDASKLAITEAMPSACSPCG
ncbi:hypothetical protein WJX79_002295 [Trebouxia sp. C0005]